MFHSYFERKISKVLTLKVVHFLNFEISAALSNKRHTSQFQNLISGGNTYYPVSKGIKNCFLEE